MKTIAAVARTHHGVTVMQTMSGPVVSSEKPNPELEARIAAVYEQYQNGDITKQEMHAKIDELVSGVSGEALK